MIKTASQFKHIEHLQITINLCAIETVQLSVLKKIKDLFFIISTKKLSITLKINQIQFDYGSLFFDLYNRRELAVNFDFAQQNNKINLKQIHL